MSAPTFPAFAKASKAEMSAASIEAKAERRAWRNHLADTIATGIPDPESYAMRLPLDLVEILVGASGRGASCRVHHSRVGELRSLGLVEFGGPFLTAFGMHVRKALLEQNA